MIQVASIPASFNGNRCSHLKLQINSWRLKYFWNIVKFGRSILCLRERIKRFTPVVMTICALKLDLIFALWSTPQKKIQQSRECRAMCECECRFIFSFGDDGNITSQWTFFFTKNFVSWIATMFFLSFYVFRDHKRKNNERKWEIILKTNEMNKQNEEKKEEKRMRIFGDVRSFDELCRYSIFKNWTNDTIFSGCACDVCTRRDPLLKRHSLKCSHELLSTIGLL